MFTKVLIFNEVVVFKNDKEINACYTKETALKTFQKLLEQNFKKTLDKSKEK